MTARISQHGKKTVIAESKAVGRRLFPESRTNNRVKLVQRSDLAQEVFYLTRIAQIVLLIKFSEEEA